MKNYAYYNDIDPVCCEWLRNLIKAGLIMDGEVDERSIIDVQADDLRGFTRHHFFSGIAGWERALQIAGWDESRPICTASLPCQPFSVAGKQLGKKDERHLFPEFERLVKECRFPTIFGEQVQGAIKLGWLDGVFDALEAESYTCGAVVLPACSVGSPHLRQRLWWVANRVGNSCGAGTWGQGKNQSISGNREAVQSDRIQATEGLVFGGNGRGGRDGRVADSIKPGLEGHSGNGNNRSEPGWIGEKQDGSVAEGCDHGRVGHAETGGCEGGLFCEIREGRNTEGKESRPARPDTPFGRVGNSESNNQQRDREPGTSERQDGEDRGSGFWDNSIWWPCSDGKARRIPAPQSGFLLLPDGFWYRMADVYSEYVTQTIKEVKNYATTVGVSPEKVMLMVQETIRKEAVQPEKNKKREAWETGRQDSFYKTEVLFTFMLDVISTLNGTANYSCGKEEVSKHDKRMLRDLRNHIEAKRASYRWKSEKYSGNKPTDTLLALSQFLAQCGQEIWAYKCRTDAAAFPLAGKVQGRVGLLKGAGNSIVPQVAAVFIKSFMEAE